MSVKDYAATINRTPRCVQKWCALGLIGKRIGGRWEIADGTEPPAIQTRKVGRIRRKARRLDNFKRDLVTT